MDIVDKMIKDFQDKTGRVIYSSESFPGSYDDIYVDYLISQLIEANERIAMNTRPNDAKWISVMGLISIEPMFEPNTKLWWTDGVAVWMATYDSEELHKGTLGRYPTHFMSIEKPTPPKQSSEGEEG